MFYWWQASNHWQLSALALVVVLAVCLAPRLVRCVRQRGVGVYWTRGKRCRHKLQFNFDFGNTKNVVLLIQHKFSRRILNDKTVGFLTVLVPLMLFLSKHKRFMLGREPWSSGCGRRLILKRLRVWIPGPYIVWTFFTLMCCKFILFVWKDRK